MVARLPGFNTASAPCAVKLFVAFGKPKSSPSPSPSPSPFDVYAFPLPFTLPWIS